MGPSPQCRMSSFFTTSLSFLPSILPSDFLPRTFICPRFHLRSILSVLAFEQVTFNASHVAVCFSRCGPIMAHTHLTICRTIPSLCLPSPRVVHQRLMLFRMLHLYE